MDDVTVARTSRGRLLRRPAVRITLVTSGLLSLLAVLGFVEGEGPAPTCAALAVAADDHTPVHRVTVLTDRTGDAPPFAVPADITAAVAGVAAAADRATVVDVGAIQGPAAGAAFWTATGYRAQPRTRRLEQQQRYGQRVAACVAGQVADARPTQPDSDVLGALQEAGRQHGSADTVRTLLVITNGLANAGALDLRSWWAGDASAATVVADLRRRGELPELTGVHVRFYGLGQVGRQARPLTSGERAWLVAFWTQLCRAAHGLGCTVDQQVTRSTLPTRPRLADAPFAAARPPERGPRGTDLLAAGLLFGPDSARLIPEAGPALAPVLRRLVGTRATALVEGHCATFGPVAGREALSRARAEAVVNYLVAHGVDRSRLRAVGWGSRRLAVPDTRPDGSLVEAAAQRNRRIVITVKETR